jgi:hypothetical protein
VIENGWGRRDGRDESWNSASCNGIPAPLNSRPEVTYGDMSFEINADFMEVNLHFFSKECEVTVWSLTE